MPGGLNKVLQVLTDAQVNVEYMYAFLGGKDVDHAYMIFRVADDKAAETALASRGIQVLDQEQVERLCFYRQNEKKGAGARSSVLCFAYLRGRGEGSLRGPYTIREHTSSAYSEGFSRGRSASRRAWP